MSQQDYTQDERFKDILIDPKFSNIQKKKLKVKIDDRFNSMLTDKKFQISQQYDKYGRKNKTQNGINQELQKFYEQEDEEQQEQQDKQVQKKGKKGKNEKKLKKKTLQQEKQGEPQKKKKKQKQNDQLQGEPKKKKKIKKNDKIAKNKKQQNKKEQDSESSSEQKSFQWSKESSDQSELSDQEEQEIDFWDEQDIIEENKLVKNEQSSDKLALVNYDWQNISAQEIMTLFNSLIKAPSYIKSVTIYPSQIGIEQLKIEQEKGPQNIWNQQAKNKKKPIEEQVNEWIVNNNDPNNAIDATKLRQYERDRLKYYYAIIQCDSQKTAEQIYNNCDGLEFELTSMKIDLRFVDSNQEFPFQPKEVCTKSNPNQKINNFLNRSLNHTNVKLTWDEPNMNRFDFVNDKLINNQEEQQKIDWTQYIGEISDDSQLVQEEDEEIQEIQDEDVVDSPLQGDPWGNDKKKRKKSLDMEITFNQGFEDLGNKVMEKQKQKNMTLWEKYQIKKKEKKDHKIEELKNKKTQQIDENDLDIKKYQAQLDLLIDKKKSKSDFKLNVNDERFSAIYQKPEWAIDPTHKSYKNESSGQILQEQIIRRKQKKL